MKADLKKKVMLAVLTMVYGGAYITSVDAAKVNIVANTVGGSYRTDIALTGVKQANKNGSITLGNQINFGTYQQSMKSGTISQISTSVNGEKIYKASGTTFNIDPVEWIVVEKDTGGTTGRYTLVSTKVLDGGVQWDSASRQNWNVLSRATTENNKNLRAFLNNSMYGDLVRGYTTTQAGLIQESLITTYKTASEYDGWSQATAGSFTSTDKLYLLSVQELKQWFAGQSSTNPTTSIYSGGNGNVPWGAGATDFALSQGQGMAMGSVMAVDGSRSAGYFLRSPSPYYSLTYVVRKVHPNGAVYSDAAAYSYFGARPVM